MTCNVQEKSSGHALKGPYESRPTTGESFIKLSPIQKYIIDRANKPDVRELTLCTSAQGIGKTMVARGLLCYWVATKGGTYGIFSPTQLASKRWAKEKFLDLFQSPALLALKQKDTDKFSILQQELLNGATIKHLACNIRDLSSASIQHILIDECDKIANDNNLEGSLLDLLQQRFKAYQRSYKFIKTSTPTIITRHEETTSKIWASYLEGSQTNLYVYSPYDSERKFPKKLETSDIWCDEGAKLENGDYDETRVMNSAYIKCWVTGKRILDSQRAAMINNGTWIDENENPRFGCLSFHSNDIYNLEMPIGAYLLKYLRSKHSYSLLKSFTQSHEGRAFDETKIFEKSSMLANGFCGDYDRGNKDLWVNLPKIAVVDVQKSVYKALIFAVNLKKVFCVDYAVFETAQEMEDFILYDWGCFAAGIDSGHKTAEIRKWVYKNRGFNWVAIDGQHDLKQDSFGKAITRNSEDGISKYKRIITEIQSNAATSKPEADFIRNGGASEYWKFFKLEETTQFIEKEIFGEFKKTKRNNKTGKMAEAWEPLSNTPHDFWDILVYMLAVHEHFLPKLRTYSPINRVRPDTPPEPEAIEVIVEEPKPAMTLKDLESMDFDKQFGAELAALNL